MAASLLTLSQASSLSSFHRLECPRLALLAWDVVFSRSFCSECFPVPLRISWLTRGVSETMLFHCQIFVYFPNLLLPLLIPIQLLIPSSPGDTLHTASAPWDLRRLVLRPGVSRGTLCVVLMCVGWVSGGSVVMLESPVCWPAFRPFPRRRGCCCWMCCLPTVR